MATLKAVIMVIVFIAAIYYLVQSLLNFLYEEYLIDDFIERKILRLHRFSKNSDYLLVNTILMMAPVLALNIVMCSIVAFLIWYLPQEQLAQVSAQFWRFFSFLPFAKKSQKSE